jgi:glycosyltransferase involved in cell wall biosynthesis
MTSALHPNPILRKVRLAYVVSHPIQYQAPLLRRIALEPDIDLTVLYGSDFSVRSYKDEGFGVNVAWDTPLLEGYKSEFLPRLRDTGGVGPLSPIKLFAKQMFLHDLRHLIAATLPIGTANAAYWRHYFGRDFPQFLLPYAVDNDYFARRAEEAATTEPALRAELNLQPGRPIILFASKLQTRKHADHLIEACSALRGKLASDPYLVIVGDGEERANLEAQVASLGLTGVRFAGFQNQSVLPRYFRLADVFVLPSRHEPWGLIVNEGAGPDLVANNPNNQAHPPGLIYPVGDIPALTHALARVLASPEKAAAMGQAARQRMSTWSFEQNIQALRHALAFTTRKIRP